MNFLKNKNILIISPESWGISFLSKHHYALILAELGNRVWFLNAPHNPTIGLSKEITEQTFGRLHLLNDITPKGIRFMPKFLQKIIMRRLMNRLEKAAGAKFDLIWSFDNSRFFHLDCFDSYSIHHVVDLQMDFNLREACMSADLCLGVTSEIASRMKLFNSNSHLIRHGWRQPIDVISKLQPNSDRPRAVYLGNLLMKSFDAELMLRLAKTYQNCDFILIGSTTTNHLTRDVDFERLATLALLKACPNVKFIGELFYDEAFATINVCDIMLLMYFNFNRPFDNSSKLMSYLSTGKVVVSNPVSEYSNTDLLCFAADRDSFIELFGRVVSDLDFWNSNKKTTERKNYVQQYSYSNLISEIDSLITQKFHR